MAKKKMKKVNLNFDKNMSPTEKLEKAVEYIKNEDQNAVEHAEGRIVALDDNKGWLYSLIILTILVIGIIYVAIK